MLKRLIFLGLLWLLLGLVIVFGNLWAGWSILFVLGLLLITATTISGAVIERRVRLVTQAMDVTSFGEEDDIGAAYEIGRLIDLVPLDRTGSAARSAAIRSTP